MAYVSTEEVQLARQVDLLTYLRCFEPENLVHVGGSTYCTKDHDSLKISNGKWHWFSRKVGGKSALDYLIKVREMPFTDAVSVITGRAAAMPPAVISPTPQKPDLLLPEKNSTNDIVKAYLSKRGIDTEIIDDCISRGTLYESKEYHNAVFIGFDNGGTPKYAAMRGTLGQFKGEATGSDKHYSFLLADDPKAESVHLFESSIDAMSYATLLKITGRDWKQIPLLSLAGVFKTVRKDVVPVALERFLKEHPQVKTILLHLDNDEIGRGAAAGIQSGLQERYLIEDRPPPSGKDVNDYLLMRLEKLRRKEVQER